MKGSSTVLISNILGLESRLNSSASPISTQAWVNLRSSSAAFFLNSASVALLAVFLGAFTVVHYSYMLERQNGDSSWHQRRLKNTCVACSIAVAKVPPGLQRV